LSRRDDAAAATVVVPDVEGVFKEAEQNRLEGEPYTKSYYLREG
jgi:hypothetical protein